eukprot:TRINITY_DN4794_c0_g1_i1.p4 TRINITY_DN4794_c0_g1~~TRINITY_DN4794_c0_g1_i1.p4  ORF type:complete len:118 (-),score=9.06 TRINITY_DN4794_c0_g1_i1:1393-1746(-)
MSLAIRVIENTEKTLKLQLEGSLDSDTYPKLESVITEKLGDQTLLVAFDLADLKFISSAGLRVIFSVIKKVKPRGGRVALTNMQPGVKKVLEIVRALPDLSVFSSTRELDEYLASFQ